GLVAHIPAGSLDLGAEPIRRLEVPRSTSCHPLFGERDDLRWRFLRLGKRLEAEDCERTTQKLVVAPFVHHRQRSGGVEVVVERGREASPGAVRGQFARASEDISE